jgi:hypothetical protein
VTALLALSAVGGCGSTSSSNSELRARRADLAEVAHALLGTREAVAHEVAAARVAWPFVDYGISRPPSGPAHTGGRARRDSKRQRAEAALRKRRDAALARRFAAMGRALTNASAEGERLPAALVSHAEELTGAGSMIAGVYELAAGLIAHGWPQVHATVTAIRGGPRAAQVFLRANVNTYIISVYDGNFDLSLLGKMVAKAYARLGGAKEFRGSLTPGEVAEIAAAYGPGVEQLHPHPWQGLVTP